MIPAPKRPKFASSHGLRMSVRQILHHWPLRFDERWKSEGAPPELVIFVHGWSCFSYPSKKDSAQVGATGTGKTTMLGELIKAKSQYDR